MRSRPRRFYDALAAAGIGGRNGFRVSTPLHAEAAKNMLIDLPRTAPRLYDQLLQLWPDVAIQARYWKELDRSSLLSEHGESDEALAAWVETLTEPRRSVARRLMLTAIKARIDAPDSYPPWHIYKALHNGENKFVPPYIDAKRKTENDRAIRAARDARGEGPTR